MDTVHGAAFISAGADSPAGGAGQVCAKDASPQRLARKERAQSAWHGMQEKFPLGIY